MLCLAQKQEEGLRSSPERFGRVEKAKELTATEEAAGGDRCAMGEVPWPSVDSIEARAVLLECLRCSLIREEGGLCIEAPGINQRRLGHD